MGIDERGLFRSGSRGGAKEKGEAGTLNHFGRTPSRDGWGGRVKNWEWKQRVIVESVILCSGKS